MERRGTKKWSVAYGNKDGYFESDIYKMGLSNISFTILEKIMKIHCPLTDPIDCICLCSFQLGISKNIIISNLKEDNNTIYMIDPYISSSSEELIEYKMKYDIHSIRLPSPQPSPRHTSTRCDDSVATWGRREPIRQNQQLNVGGVGIALRALDMALVQPTSDGGEPKTDRHRNDRRWCTRGQ